MNDEANIWHIKAHSESVCADNNIRGRQYPADEPSKKDFSFVGGSKFRVVERDMKAQGG